MPSKRRTNGTIAALFGASLVLAGSALYLGLNNDDLRQRLESISPFKRNNQIVGGAVVGQNGSGFYAGYTLSWGDDFDALDIVGPANPRGKFFPTGAYHPGIRGNTTSLGTAFDADPLTTGYKDGNRGIAVAFDNMSVSNSVLRLGARKATAREQAFLTPTDRSINGGIRPQLSAMIHTAGAFAYYPTTNAVIVEMRARFSSKLANPAGFHPAFWTYSVAPVLNPTGNEWDLECNSQGMHFSNIVHTSGTISTDNSAGPFDYMDDTFHVFSFVFRNGENTQLYVDGALRSQFGVDSNTKSMPSFVLLTSHIFNNVFANEAYNAAAWAGSATGAYFDIDWIRGWRTAGVTHWKPLVSVADLNVDYAGGGKVVLPSAKALWGDASVTEFVQVVPYDSAEPGMADQTTFTQFPPGISYDATSRTIRADFTTGTGNAGRSHVVVYGYKPDGSTMEPLRFSINRGPRMTTGPLSAAAGESYRHDIYEECDVGVMTPKTLSVKGLPQGLSLDPSAGLITGTPAATGVSNLTISCTNNAGQTATRATTLTVGAPDPAGRRAGR
ncbi:MULTISPECIES: putative Ig domain-containing protein [unclassified Bradyrhizobium]|uniref:putative Ig domain-containing protein n=1 Tax=unclassified Bradyrhizobium TaxID=2631580 RepID=UPI002478435F|nr:MULTISPECIES: putative Ig domain-containing protein [unclassified Bradyrhizobium]WGR73518.1 putative Ig domain-containing protein [Bradyrhizobium sp. ISRA426]WGR78355.1 putative Ig domain-containing protein [Bradyrhizobium sp. ISRA430]WGR88756.1 putative Ig domain-containing protein [Bradyrhizobium sp. ISRA432]